MNITNSLPSFNNQSSKSSPELAEFVTAEAVELTWYATKNVTNIRGFRAGLASASLWAGELPALWDGLPFNAQGFALQLETLARSQNGQPPEKFLNHSRAARSAAARILGFYRETVEKHRADQSSLEEIKAEGSLYRKTSPELRMMDPRISSALSGFTRHEVKEFNEKFGPKSEAEPFCAEYLEAWNGCIDLDIDGLFGWHNGQPTAEFLARALPRLGIAGLIAVQQSPSGCGFNPLFFIGRSNAPRNRRELIDLYWAIYDDLARYCAALGVELPNDRDGQFAGRTNLINTPRRASPFPWFGPVVRWQPSETRAGEGVKRRRVAFVTFNGPLGKSDAAQVVHKNEEPVKIWPWRPNSIELPAPIESPIEFDPRQQLSGSGFGSIELAPVAGAPSIAEVEKRRAEEKARRQEEARRRLAEYANRAGSGASYEGRKSAYLEKIIRDEVNLIANCGAGGRDRETFKALCRLGRRFKEQGEPEEIPDPIADLVTDALETNGLLGSDEKWQKPRKYIQRAFSEGWKSADLKPLEDRPFSPSKPARPNLPLQSGPAPIPDPPRPSVSPSPSDRLFCVPGPAPDLASRPSKKEPVVLPSAGMLQEAAEAIFKAIRSDIFYCAGDWYKREGRIFAKVSKFEFHSLIIKAIQDIGLCFLAGPAKRGRKGEQGEQVTEEEARPIPYPQTSSRIADLEKQIKVLCDRFGRSQRKEMRFDGVIENGRQNSEVYLTADGRAVRFDRDRDRVQVTDQAAEFVSQFVHFETAPAMKNPQPDGSGDLITLADLPADHKIQRLLNFYSVGNLEKKQRLLSHIGRLLARRMAFDRSSEHSVLDWYGAESRGKGTLRHIIEIIRGGELTSGRKVNKSALDSDNRFGAAALFGAQNNYIDDVVFDARKNVSTILNLADTEQTIERKGKEAEQVHCSPNFVIISNSPPPVATADQAGAIARRLSVFNFSEYLTEAQGREFYNWFADDPSLQSVLSSVAIAEYFRQRREGYVKTSDDDELDAQVAKKAPLRAWIARFLRPSDQDVSEHEVKKWIREAELVSSEEEGKFFWRLNEAIKAEFGVKASHYPPTRNKGKSSHPKFFVNVNPLYKRLIDGLYLRRKTEPNCTLSEYADEIEADEVAAEQKAEIDSFDFSAAKPKNKALPSGPETEPVARSEWSTREPLKIAPVASPSPVSIPSPELATPDPIEIESEPEPEPALIPDSLPAASPSPVRSGDRIGRTERRNRPNKKGQRGRGAFGSIADISGAFADEFRSVANRAGWRPALYIASIDSSFRADLKRLAQEIKEAPIDQETRAKLARIIDKYKKF